MFGVGTGEFRPEVYGTDTLAAAAIFVSHLAHCSAESDFRGMGDYPTLGRDLDFSEVLDAWGTDDFKEVVISLLQQHETDLPLERLCRAGGGPDWEEHAEYDLGDPEECDAKIILTGDVWFKESIPTGCRDINFKEDRHGSVIVEIDRKSGSANVEVEPEERNLEYY